MRIYSKQQDDMFFLSPYSQIKISENGLYVYSTLFSTTAQLSCSQDKAQKLLGMLQAGVGEKELQSFFQAVLPSIDLTQLLTDWMRKGVVE